MTTDAKNLIQTNAYLDLLKNYVVTETQKPFNWLFHVILIILEALLSFRLPLIILNFLTHYWKHFLKQ